MLHSYTVPRCLGPSHLGTDARYTGDDDTPLNLGTRSVCESVSLSVCLSVCMSVCLSVWQLKQTFLSPPHGTRRLFIRLCSAVCPVLVYWLDSLPCFVPSLWSVVIWVMKELDSAAFL